MLYYLLQNSKTFFKIKVKLNNPNENCEITIHSPQLRNATEQAVIFKAHQALPILMQAIPFQLKHADLKPCSSALAGGVQRTAARPVNAPGSISDRAHTWVAGQVPTWGCARGNQSTGVFLAHDVSLPLSLLPFPSL